MAEEKIVAHPPETTEGWYALHQIFRIDPAHRDKLVGAKSSVFGAPSSENGWSAAVRLIGSMSDVMFVHFRPTLDEIGVAQRAVAREPWAQFLIPTYSFLSVTEAGLYRLTAMVAKQTAERGGKIGDEAYQQAIVEGREKELADPHSKRRLYPPLPADKPYVCFYPMSKKRDTGQNWYAQTLDERGRLMWEHGMTGRRYAGRVQQVITGAIGFDAWEWGVTLFAADPLEFKKIVSEMRFDEASSKYGEFGEFWVGRTGELSAVLDPND